MKYIVLLYFLISIGQVSAMNLLSNGTFDSNINGWSSLNSTTGEWVSDDGASVSGNGSIRITGTINNNGTFGLIAEPITVKPGYWYITAGSLKTPAVSVSERGLYSLEWYDMSNGFVQYDSVASNFGIPDDVWIDLDGYIQAPENATSVIMGLRFQTGAPEEVDHPFGLWDDVIFMEETIFFSDFA